MAAETTNSLPTITLTTTGTVASVAVDTRKSNSFTSTNSRNISNTISSRSRGLGKIFTNTNRDNTPTSTNGENNPTSNNGENTLTNNNGEDTLTINSGENIPTSISEDQAVINTTKSVVSSATTTDNAVIDAAITDAPVTDTVATAITVTAASVTATSTPIGDIEPDGHTWIVPIVSVMLSLIFIGLAIFCIRKTSSKYKQRKSLLGEGSNEGFMREINTNGNNGGEKFDQSSFNSEEPGDEFNNSKDQSFFGITLDSAIGFSAASGYEQGILNDATDGGGVNLTTEDDDPFADTTTSTENILFKNASSDVAKGFKAREPLKIKTHDLVEMFANDGESPGVYSDSFNFHGVPFQNNEYSYHDEVEPLPTLRSTLSRTPTVISAFSELAERFLSSPPPPPPASSPVNITSDGGNNTSSNSNSIKDIRDVIMNASSSDLLSFDNLVSVNRTSRRGTMGESTSTEYPLRSILSGIDNGNPSAIGKDDEVESKSLAEELSTVLTISSAIESTALPILSTYDDGVFEKSSEDIIKKPLDDFDATERSHNNTEGLHGDITERSQNNAGGSRADIIME